MGSGRVTHGGDVHSTFRAHSATGSGPPGLGSIALRRAAPAERASCAADDGGVAVCGKGLENVPGAVGFSQAAGLVTAEENAKLSALRDHLIERLLREVPHTTLNGHRTRRIPQNANITFHFVEGESITLHLDLRGFAVSTGSACFSRSLEASHVIAAIGGDHERAHGSIRFTLGRFNSQEEVDAAAGAIAEVVEELRKISPLAEKKS